MMAFDGNKYLDASPTLPVYYHPGSPFQAEAVSNCLKNAYYSAQQNSRFVFQQVYPVNQKMVSRDQSEFSILSGSLVRIAANHVFIPENVVNVVCSIIYSAIADVGGSVEHKMTLTNSSAASVFVTESVPISPTSGRLGGDGNFRSNGIATSWNTNVIDFLPLSRTEISLEVEKGGSPLIALNNLCAIEVAARAHSTSSSGSTIAETYRPYFLSCWWEVVAV